MDTVTSRHDTDAPGDAPGAAPAAPLDLTLTQQVSHAAERRRLELLASKRDAWRNRLELHLADAGWYRRAAARWEPGRPSSPAELDRQERAAIRRADYARRRVETLSRHLTPRAARCGTGERWVRCGCGAGAAYPLPTTCNVRGVCASCDGRRARKLRRRVVAAVDAHVAAARRARRSARIRLITLTIQHSGDLARDRAELARGWRELRKSLHRWWGGMPPFVFVWETTRGRDGLGHEHAHVLVVGGPTWWNYAAIRRAWLVACPRSTNLDIDARGPQTAAGAGRYVSKYVTKGCQLDGSWSDELVAQWLAAHYGARMVSTSRGFWAFHVEQRPCRYCGELHKAAAKPSEWELAKRKLAERLADRWLAEGSTARAGPFHVEHPAVFHVEHVTH